MSNQVFVAQTLSHTLPFNERLSWEDFQTLCTDLLKTDGRFGDARDFLAKGSAQEGIDVYAIPLDENKKTVAQCKKEKYVSPKELHEIVDMFLGGAFKENTKEFILCTSYDFKTSKSEIAIDEVRSKLKASEIDFILWDKSGLESELRSKPRPQLVTRYFGEEIALAFYGKIFSNWIKQYQQVKKQSYNSDSNYIERTLTPYHELKERQSQLFWNTRNKTLVELFEQTLLEQGKRITILSTAGFGKTWETEHLAAYYSDETKILFPIKYYLRDYEGQSIDTLMKLNPDWNNIPKETLLLIFDGFDEVRENYFEPFSHHLNQFIEINPQVNVSVSCRFNFYDLTFPPLRNFEVYVLDEFTDSDINRYLETNLGIEKAKFLEKIEESGFSEYVSNPYYLTRLVRFYKNKNNSFPENKPKFFERILFERFDSDNNRYHTKLQKPDFFVLAEKVAFLMTAIGKSSLDDEELEHIIEDRNIREDFQSSFLLTKGITSQKAWTFEHKNLQEYLCASFLQRVPFSSIKKLISFPHTTDKLQPRFLNTVSFLFSSADSNLFGSLFTWLNASQPELLVRFEKERISKSSRIEILKRVLDYYGEKDLPLYTSLNFTLAELANFVDIDKDVIDYFEVKLFEPKTSNWLAYDIVRLLSECRKSYLFKEQLIAILLKALAVRRNFNQFSANCVYALTALKLFEKNIAENIFQSGIDLTDFEIRSAFVSYIDNANLIEEYCDFILSSRNVYAEVQKDVISIGPNELLQSIITKFKKTENVKSVLQLASTESDFISDASSYEKMHLNKNDTERLLLNAQAVYKEDLSILEIVYAIFIKNPVLAYDDELALSFKHFFSATSGLFEIFKRLYRCGQLGRNLMLFVDKQGCDFILDEYRAGQISDVSMGRFRNLLSHEDRDLFLQFQTILDSEFSPKFLIEDSDFDYGEMRQSYVKKNQQMLLDKKVFFEEADRLFEALEKKSITQKDLYIHDDVSLLKFQDSWVLQDMRRRAEFIPKNKDELIGYLHDDENWSWFKIEKIETLLRNQKETSFIEPQLIEFANKWCIQNLQSLDYDNSIYDNELGTMTADSKVIFNNKLFSLLNIDVADEVLLRILKSDYSGGMNKGELGLAGKVIDKIQDKDLQRRIILKNIEDGLPSWVLKTHFALCAYLHYAECTPSLYNAILNNKNMSTHDQIVLTDYYIDLGGSVEDFSAYVGDNLQIEHYNSWNWHLIGKTIVNNQELAIPILVRVLGDLDQPEANKIYACKLLMQAGKIEALQFWRDFILTNKRTPFDHHQDVVIQHAPGMNIKAVLPILIEILEFTYENNLHILLRFSESIEDAVYAILYAVSLKNITNFNEVSNALAKMLNKFDGELFARNIEFQKERIIQNFYKQQRVEMSLGQALEAYAKLNSNEDIEMSEKPRNWLSENKKWIIGIGIPFLILLLSILAHLKGLL